MECVQQNVEVEFKFEKIDYDNYEFEDVGLLNFNKPPREILSEKKISKRRFRPIGGQRREREDDRKKLLITTI